MYYHPIRSSRLLRKATFEFLNCDQIGLGFKAIEKYKSQEMVVFMLKNAGDEVGEGRSDSCSFFRIITF